MTKGAEDASAASVATWPDADLVLDLKGLKCPLPVLHTRKALQRLAPGARLKVLCTDPMAAIDIPHLIHETGDVLEEKARDETTLAFLVRRRA